MIAAALVIVWVLLAPPDAYRNGGIRLDDDAPLYRWRQMGTYEDAAECTRARADRIAKAADDTDWGLWSKSRCSSASRAEGGRLTPDERDGRRSVR